MLIVTSNDADRLAIATMQRKTPLERLMLVAA
jgi:hypothetical protein